MEPLRWILLLAGIIFVILIYVLGRKRRRRKNNSARDGVEGELPAFSAKDSDDVGAGIGDVEIVTSKNAVDDYDVLMADHGNQSDSEQETSNAPTGNAAAGNEETAHAKAKRGSPNKTPVNKTPANIVVLYILPKQGDELIGSRINSSVQAMGLVFGEMDIYHYQPRNRSIFSIANMLEPGSFDVDNLDELKTSGLTVFMQITRGDPLGDLTEMLQRSYQLAGLLSARLCNGKRQPLTEQDAEDYRKRVKDFLA